MKLQAEDLKLIREALRDAFPAATKQLRRVVADSGIGVDFAGYEGDYEDRIQTLLEHAAGQYRLTRLLQAAVDAAPDNPELSEIAQFIKPYVTFVPRLLPRERDRTALQESERLLFENIGFQNIRNWIEKLERLSRVICRIEPQPRDQGISGYGTGFLVAPDVILTNDHVVSGDDGKSGFWSKPDLAAQVRVRFDCVYDADGRASEGVTYGLAADYQVLRSPLKQLDFALLRIDVSTPQPADAVLGAPRGFVIPIAHEFEESEPLLILQHPQAEPMKLAFGSLSPKSQWPAGEIAYSVNTDGGSSGSPCLTQDLEVGALHHVGGQTANYGVLISAIVACWNTSENRQTLLSKGLAHLIDATKIDSSLESITSTEGVYTRSPTVKPRSILEDSNTTMTRRIRLWHVIATLVLVVLIYLVSLVPLPWPWSSTPKGNEFLGVWGGEVEYTDEQPPDNKGDAIYRFCSPTDATGILRGSEELIATSGDYMRENYAHYRRIIDAMHERTGTAVMPDGTLTIVFSVVGSHMRVTSTRAGKDRALTKAELRRLGDCNTYVEAEQKAARVSCHDYLERQPVGALVACNDLTAAGYYWRIGRKLTRWPGWGYEFSPTLPACGTSEQIGSRAETGRFDPTAAWIGVVAQISPAQRLPDGTTITKFEFNRGRKPYDPTNETFWTTRDYPNTGIFEATCRRIPND